MNENLKRVAQRINDELHALQDVVNRTQKAFELAKKNPTEADFYLDSVALNLHDFYTGIERVMEVIGANIDNFIPEGKHWHSELLKQMSQENQDVRPAVFLQSTRNFLDEYLRFRHVVRNLYSFDFDINRMKHLVERLNEVFDQIKKELVAFAQFIEEIRKKE